MSVCTSAIVAAMKAVAAPTTATTSEAVADAWKSGASRATMYTPAVTMVAAWIRADTGVGPSIASGSQTCSGICALLPQAPTNSSRQTAVITPTSPSGSGASLPASSAMSHQVQRAERVERQDHAQDEAGVADAVDDERLLARVGRALLLEPEADQQVRAEPDAFPAHEHQREVAAQHQQQHEEREEVQVGEVADAVLVVGHVAERVDVDQRAHARHHQHQQRRERVEQQRERDLQRRRR